MNGNILKHTTLKDVRKLEDLSLQQEVSGDV